MSENQFVRREKRFEVENSSGFEVIVSRSESDENLYFADLMDFSRSGIKFCLPFSARFDELLRIRLTFSEFDIKFESIGRVRHIRNTDVNRWVVGCSISPNLTDEMINCLAAATHQERRKDSRLDVFGNGLLSTQGRLEEAAATVRNVSKGGFCLALEEPHEIGSQVNFNIENRYGFQEQIDARIRWQKEDDGGYLIGLSFIDVESHDRLVNCLEMPKLDEGRAADLLNWKVITCAMIAMLTPTVSYLLLGAGVDSNKNDVFKARNRPRAEVKSTVDPAAAKPSENQNKASAKAVNSVSGTNGRTKDVRPQTTPRQAEAASALTTKRPPVTQSPAEPPAERKTAAVPAATTRTNKSTLQPPSALTTRSTRKPRRLRVATTTAKSKKQQSAKADRNEKSQSNRSKSKDSQSANETSRRSDRERRVDIPSESLGK